MGQFDYEQDLIDAGCTVDIDGYVWDSNEDPVKSTKRGQRKHLSELVKYLKNGKLINENGYIQSLKKFEVEELKHLQGLISMNEWYSNVKQVQLAIDLIQKHIESRETQ